MLKHAETYEIISPELVGADSAIVLGKLSGKAAYRKRLQELGYTDLAADEEKLVQFVGEAKAVADGMFRLSKLASRHLSSQTLGKLGAPPSKWRR